MGFREHNLGETHRDRLIAFAVANTVASISEMRHSL